MMKLQVMCTIALPAWIVTQMAATTIKNLNFAKPYGMRYILLTILILFLAVINLKGQTEKNFVEGSISYVTSQSVYVKFSKTDNIQAGDTLYLKQGDHMIPALQVKNLSSISCVCLPLIPGEFKINDVVLSVQYQIIESPAPVILVTTSDSALATVEEVPDSLSEVKEQKPLQQDIRGRVSISSYSNFSNTDSPTNQRMRYTLSFKGDQLKNSKLSVETYMSFVHSNTKWDEIQENMFNGLKIYNLAAKYDFNENTRLLLGRKINPTISNVGAIDGIQFEKNIKSFIIGAFAGSRPDYRDYGFDFNLLQYGAYLGHKHSKGKKMAQSSLAFVEQNNTGKTDRRFLYFQHTNSLVKNLFFFGTVEVDLYKKINDQPENTFDLTNLYLSLRYRIFKQLSISASYSARNNIVYYETYKNFIDRILEAETLQGWRLQLNYRPIKYLAIGVKGGYRFREADPKPSRNLYAYMTYSRVPGINAAITLSATMLETSYLSGKIYSLGISRDLVPGKLSGGFNYRMVDYSFVNSEMDLPQHIGDINLNWRIYRKLSLSLNYEGTFENERSYNRIYVNLSQRF